MSKLLDRFLGRTLFGRFASVVVYSWIIVLFSMSGYYYLQARGYVEIEKRHKTPRFTHLENFKLDELKYVYLIGEKKDWSTNSLKKVGVEVVELNSANQITDTLLLHMGKMGSQSYRLAAKIIIRSEIDMPLLKNKRCLMLRDTYSPEQDLHSRLSDYFGKNSKNYIIFHGADSEFLTCFSNLLNK